LRRVLGILAPCAVATRSKGRFSMPTRSLRGPPPNLPGDMERRGERNPVLAIFPECAGQDSLGVLETPEVRFIPAHAGSGRRDCEATSSGPFHPRMLGERSGSPDPYRWADGSSRQVIAMPWHCWVLGAKHCRRRRRLPLPFPFLDAPRFGRTGNAPPIGFSSPSWCGSWRTRARPPYECTTLKTARRGLLARGRYSQTPSPTCHR
jgi:hypothetical protein